MATMRASFAAIALTPIAVAQGTAQAVDTSSAAVAALGRAIYEGKTGGACMSAG